jgi:hypothetical protein
MQLDEELNRVARDQTKVTGTEHRRESRRQLETSSRSPKSTLLTRMVVERIGTSKIRLSWWARPASLATGV